MFNFVVSDIGLKIWNQRIFNQKRESPISLPSYVTNNYLFRFSRFTFNVNCNDAITVANSIQL